MDDQAPIHLLAKFAEKDHFLQNYMFHVPSGGLFVDLGAGTPPPLMAMDRRELVGRVAEVRIQLSNPRLDLGFRGAVTYASPYRAGINHRRIGVEFFRYENSQKEFLLEFLNAEERSAFQPRRSRRFPFHLRVQFRCPTVNNRFGVIADAKDPRLVVVGRTDDLSMDGCNLHAIRFFQPGTKVEAELYLPEECPEDSSAAVACTKVPVDAIVRWQDAENFRHRFMGLEFTFDSPRCEKSQEKLQNLIGQLQHKLEIELIERRNLGPAQSV